MSDPKSSLFPDSLHDPFNHHKKEDENTPSSWPSQGNHIPRWSIQTEEEANEQSKRISRLESKLNSLHKKRPVYDIHTIPGVSHSDDDSSLHNEGLEEDHEGLPLLWNNNVDTVEDAPRKTESHYYGSFFSAFWCCH